MAWKQKWVRGSGVGGDMCFVSDLYIPRTPAEEKESARQTTAGEKSCSPRQRDADPDMAWKHKLVKLSSSGVYRSLRMAKGSARQTTARERSRSPRQRDAVMAWNRKWGKVSSSGVGGNMFSVNDLYIPRTPAEEKTQLLQAFYESQRTARKQIDDAGPSKVMEDAAKTHSCPCRYGNEKEALLRQVSSSGVGGDMFSVNDLYIPRTPAEEKAQLLQAFYESRRTARRQIDDAGPSKVMEDAAKTHSCPCRYGNEKEALLRQVSSSGVGGNMFSVNDLYIPRTPAEEKAQLLQAFYESQRTARKQIDDAGPSKVMEDAAKTHSYPCHHGNEKEALLRQVSSSGMGGDMFSVDDLYIPRTPAEEKAQLLQAFYESQRTARKQIDDAGPSKVMEDAAKTHSCSCRYGNEKEALLQQESAGLCESQRTTRKQVDDAGPLRVMQDAAEEYSRSLHSLAEKEAELQQALHKLARILKEVVGSFGGCS